MFKNLSPGNIGLKANFQQALDLAKRYGFGGIDAPLSDLGILIDQRGLPTVKNMLESAGVQAAAFFCPTNFRADEGTWEAGLKQLPRLARTAQAVGCTRCGAWIMPASDTLDYAANFELHVSRLQPIAKILKEHGIRLGLEFVAPRSARKGKRHEFVWNIEGVLELCEAIGTGNMGLVLDAWHWHASHGTLEDLGKLTAAEVVSVHVSDAPKGIAVDDLVDQVRDMPGATGVINMTGFLQSLKAIGYDGPVTAEPCRKDLGSFAPDVAVKLVAESLEKIWQQASV